MALWMPSVSRHSIFVADSPKWSRTLTVRDSVCFRSPTFSVAGPRMTVTSKIGTPVKFTMVMDGELEKYSSREDFPRRKPATPKTVTSAMMDSVFFISLIERLGDTSQTASARFGIVVHPDVGSSLFFHFSVRLNEKQCHGPRQINGKASVPRRGTDMVDASTMSVSKLVPQ